MDLSPHVEKKEDSKVKSKDQNNPEAHFYWFLILKELWHLLIYCSQWDGKALAVVVANEGKLQPENRQFGHFYQACKVAAVFEKWTREAE